MFRWEAFIQGPEGTPFEGGVFPAELLFPPSYPLEPPKMKFECDMWHPNSEYQTDMAVALATQWQVFASQMARYALLLAHIVDPMTLA